MEKDLSQKRNLPIILIVVIVILIGIGLVLFFPFNFKNKILGTTLYKIVYYDDGVPGSKYDISVFDNNKIEIVETSYCSALDCDSTTTTENFKYSKSNFEKLKTFVDNNFSKKQIELHPNELTDKQKEVIQGLLVGENFFEISVEEYKYKIQYSESDNLSYYIYIKNDNSIIVKKVKINDNYDITNVNTYSLNFSQKSKTILTDYVLKELKKDKDKDNVIYKNSLLRKDEINIFNSITKNDESYLNNVENVKLSYTISYEEINCDTPKLYLYSDNSFEYNTFAINESNEQILKSGIYNYDIKKIIDNIDKYKDDNHGSYSIIDKNGNEYITYSTNIELEELLSSLNITLKTCLVSNNQ